MYVWNQLTRTLVSITSYHSILLDFIPVHKGRGHCCHDQMVILILVFLSIQVLSLLFYSPFPTALVLHTSRTVAHIEIGPIMRISSTLLLLILIQGEVFSHTSPGGNMLARAFLSNKNNHMAWGHHSWPLMPWKISSKSQTQPSCISYGTKNYEEY